MQHAWITLTPPPSLVCRNTVFHKTGLCCQKSLRTQPCKGAGGEGHLALQLYIERRALQTDEGRAVTGTPAEDGCGDSGPREGTVLGGGESAPRVKNLPPF